MIPAQRTNFLDPEKTRARGHIVAGADLHWRAVDATSKANDAESHKRAQTLHHRASVHFRQADPAHPMAEAHAEQAKLHQKAWLASIK